MSVCEFLADWKTWKGSGARSKANFSELSLVTEERIPLPSRWSSASPNPSSAAPRPRLFLTNMLTRGRLLTRKKQGKETSAILSSLSFYSFLSLFPSFLFFQSAIRGHYHTRLVFPLYALPDKFHKRVLPLPVRLHLLIVAKGIAELQRCGNVVEYMANT